MVETLGSVTVMEKLLLAVLASVLLLSLGLVMSESIPNVKALSEIHQGDLILTGNNVTTIEGAFSINGSIIVENNATLVLKDAVINFTQSQMYQHNLTLTNPVGGKPRLQAENTTITSGFYMILYLYGTSTMTADNLTASENILLYSFDSSAISLSKSQISSSLYVFSSGVNVTLFSSQIEFAIIEDSSNVLASDTSLVSMQIRTRFANFSVSDFNAGTYSFWNFLLNCSVLVAPGGYAPNVTFLNSHFDALEFIIYDSNATIRDTTLALQEYGTCFVQVHDSWLTYLGIHESSVVWIVNPSTVSYGELDGNGTIYISWYLDVHVLDSIDQNVPSATVSAFYPNSTLAESEPTNSSGWTKLTLMEKLVNITGSYPVGNYNVSAAYLAYSNFTDVNMNRSQQIILTLSGLMVPEFPSILVLPLFMIITLLAAAACKKREKLSRAIFAS